MNQYQNAGKGLKKMFIAQVGAIVCTVLAVIPLVNLIGGIGALVFAVLSLVGLYGAGQEIAGCKTAFILTVVSIVLSIVAMFFAANPVMTALFSIADSVLSFLVVYYVCNSVAEVMSQVGANDVAAKGVTVWKVNLGCYIATIVISILAFIPVLNVIAVFAGVVVLVVSVVAAILYMIFLNRSYQALGA